MIDPVSTLETTTQMANVINDGTIGQYLNELTYLNPSLYRDDILNIECPFEGEFTVMES